MTTCVLIGSFELEVLEGDELASGDVDVVDDVADFADGLDDFVVASTSSEFDCPLTTAAVANSDKIAHFRNMVVGVALWQMSRCGEVFL